jgi:hypothetical protein
MRSSGIEQLVEESGIAICQVLPCCLWIHDYSHARAIGHVDHSVFQREAVEEFGVIVPEWFETGRLFERDKVVRKRC